MSSRAERNRAERLRRAWADIAAIGAGPAEPPITGAAVWTQVIERARGQCECEGCSARPHLKRMGRCRKMGTFGQPLHAVPLDGPDDTVAAMRLHVGQLQALCEMCHAAAQAKVHKAERAATEQALRDAPGLFPDHGLRVEKPLKPVRRREGAS